MAAAAVNPGQIVGEHMVQIQHMNRQLRFRVVHYRGDIWRADVQTIQKGVTAAVDYAAAPIKYFSTSRREVQSYVDNNNMPYVKQWRPQRDLELIDMFDRETRDSVRTLLVAPESQEALNVAFPLNVTGTVYRVSTPETARLDDIVLRGICLLGFADGYYIPEQIPRSRVVRYFHSEIGMCQRVFNQLVLMDVERAAPPRQEPVRRPVRGRRRHDDNEDEDEDEDEEGPYIPPPPIMGQQLAF